MMRQKNLRIRGKWGKRWQWWVLSWTVIAVLSYLLTTFLFATVSSQASSPQFSAGGNWPMYLGDPARTGYNQAETKITRTTAPNLKLHWMYHAGFSISAEPAVFNGKIYWGSWDGYEHATDLTGKQIWQTFLGQTSDQICHPPVAGVASSAAVAVVPINGTARTVVFVGGGDAYFYALDAATGTRIWRTKLGTPPDTFLWSSPAVYKGSVYMGVSSFGDCPLVQGKLVKMDASTGVIQRSFNTVPFGCIGGAVWSSPTIAPGGEVYIATGTIHPQCPTVERMTLSMIELHASDLSYVGSWQLPPSDWIGDSTDFGASPTLFQAMIGGTRHYLVGAVNKNGKFYAFQRGAIGKGPVWEAQIAGLGKCPACGQGSISPSVWDGTKLYIAGGATTIKGVSCLGSVQAVDPATGAFIWQRCLQDGAVLAPITLIPGVAVVTAGKDVLLFNTDSGQIIKTLTDSRGNSRYFAGAAVSNGVLYVGNMDWNFYAYGL